MKDKAVIEWEIYFKDYVQKIEKISNSKEEEIWAYE